MGLFFSCCRRHKDSKDREPLLPKDRVNAAANEYLPSQTQLEKLADVVAALKTGKLPSQDQLNGVIQSLLRSTSPNQSYGTLSEQGKQVVSDFRTLLETLLQLGLEKNDDNELQELIYQVSNIPTVPVHADVIVNANESGSLDVQDVVGQIPSREEAESDVRTIIHSIRQLSTILLTSSTFRIILSDLFKVAREIVADTAADVGRIAATVEASADKVEEALRPEGATLEDVKINSEVAREEVVNEASAISEETQTRWNHLSTESPERTKEAVVGRLQQAIAQAHSNPDYQTALRSLLYLFQDYASRLSDISAALADAKAPSITPILWTDPHLSQALTHLATLISRLASGRSVDSWVSCLQAVIVDIGKLPSGLTAENDELHELRDFFSDLSSWLDQALDSPQYATSSVGQHNAEALYDRAHHLMNEASRSDRPWAQHIRDLIHETDVLLDGISNDRTANRFIGAVSALSTSLSNYTYKLVRQAPGQLEESKRRLRNQLQRDVLQWLLPRLLRALRVIPVPRVEFRSNSLDAAIDTLYLTPSSAQLSLVPDHIHVQNWTELHLDMSEVHPEAEAIIPAVEYNGMQTHTKLRVSVQGIRVSARNIAYYACYRLFGSNKWLSWLGYEDEGLASVDVGSRGAKDEGLNFEFELQFPPNDEDGNNIDDQPLFFVRDVRVDVPGLQLSLDRSKHWILNKLFLQPLAAPVGRLATAWVLRNQAHALLESLADVGGKVVRGAHRSALDSRRELATGDYINAVWRALTGPSDQTSEESGYRDETEAASLVETHSRTTAKGIVRTNVTYSAEAAGRSDPVTRLEESTLAIGVGEQILPGKGGPHDYQDEQEAGHGPRELAREAMNQIQSQVDALVEAQETAGEQATSLRREAIDATKRARQQEHEEADGGGWRSSAFNI